MEISPEEETPLIFPDPASRRSVVGNFNVQDPHSSEETYSQRHSRHHHHSHVIEEHKMLTFESLDFKQSDNVPLRNWHHRIQPKIKTYNFERLLAKWSLYTLIGFVIGLTALGIKKTVEALQGFKIGSTKSMMTRENGHIYSFLVYYSINLLYAVGASVIVFLTGPTVASSGVPEVKGWLNGVRVPNTLNFLTYIGKITSLMLSYSSCLALGPEGPMVHIGALVGAGIGSAKNRLLRFRLPRIFEKFRNHSDQRDFIAAGTAAGISAAFGAPVGGVLYALEETSTFWSRELTWRTFWACMIAAFTVNLLQNMKNQSSVLQDYGLLTFGISKTGLYRIPELVPMALLGVIAGILGFFFAKMNARINLWRRENLKTMGHKILEVAVMVTIVVFLVFSIPALSNCEPTSKITYDSNVCDNTNANQTAKVLDHIFCDRLHYNEFANLMVIPQEDALKLLFSRSHGMFSYMSLFLFLGLWYMFTTMVAGLTLTGGLFVPMMLIGATFGRIVGQGMQDVFGTYATDPPIDASIYALVGAAAMMSGFSRITISLCVIVIELTENTQYLLPIMIAVMLAKWIGDGLGKAIYEEMLEVKSIPFLEFHPPSHVLMLSVTDRMSSPAICVHDVENLSNVVKILKFTRHNGFPVVSKAQQYVGLILRKQLLIMLRNQLYERANRAPPEPLDYEVYLRMMNTREPTTELEDYNLPPELEQQEFFLDIKTYMDRSHPVANISFSFIEAYKLFQTLGLRHLPVVDHQNIIQGILTRHDFLSFHFE